jgi:hypothetical protein
MNNSVPAVALGHFVMKVRELILVISFIQNWWPREHLIDQDISRFDAKADDPSQVPYHAAFARP